MNEDRTTKPLNRRQVLIGTVSAPTILTTPGCIHLLMRLFVGRGAAGLLGRAGVAGGARLGATFGRGIAVGSSAARMSVGRAAVGRQIVPNSHILDATGSRIASTRTTKGGVITSIRGSDVMLSRKRGKRHDHEDTRGSTGSSEEKFDYVEHKDTRGRVSGFDKIRLARKIVEHYDPDEKPLGSTRLDVNNDRVLIHSDDETIRALEDYEKALCLDDPVVKAAYDEWQLGQAICYDHGQSCGANALRHDAYETLWRRCISRKSNY